LRNQLLAEHCGATAADVAELLDDTGSLLAVTDVLSRNGHALRPIDDGEPDSPEVAGYIEGLADPTRPITLRSILGPAWYSIRRVVSGGFAKFAIAGLILLCLTLAWQFSPLSELVDAAATQRFIDKVAQSYWGPLAVLGAFVAGGLVAFPLLILIAATAASFGPWFGFVYGLVGALASAVVTYGIGAAVGRDALDDFLGDRLTNIRNKITKQGVLAVVAIRLVPIAPFTLVNLVAGASGIRLSHYIIGTVLGLVPGLVLMSLLGSQIMRIISSPSPTEILTFAALIAAWIAMVFGIQAAVSKYGSAS
jgi:uncharacterized membrane protein YdjX (TVP38/TMEM64 family)